LETGSSKQADHLLLLLHAKSRADSKLMPLLTEAEGTLASALKWTQHVLPMVYLHTNESGELPNLKL